MKGDTATHHLGEPGLQVSILDRVFKKKLEEQASQMGFTAVQLRVLGELSRLEALGVEEINQKDLEKALAVTHPTMTEIIKRLEKKQAVLCTPSKIDKRYKKICCTEAYADIHAELKKMDWGIFEDMCQGISQEDRSLFLYLLEKMLDNVSE
jgi:DNA-binding MarR family transcriptional regulator